MFYIFAHEKPIIDLTMESAVVLIVAIIISILVALTTETNKEREYVYESVVKSDNENENKTDCESNKTIEDEIDHSTDRRTNYNNILMETPKGTRDLFLETLSKIGCQYELGEGDDKDRIYFAYQGENFLADASNEGRYVNIWDPCWEHVELYDIDELSRLRKAINYSNLNCSTTTVFTIDEAGHTFDVHCKAVILFIPQIPEIENYLRVELNDFFRAHQIVAKEMAKQRVAENA